MGDVLKSYLDFIKNSGVRQKHQFILALHRLSRKVARPLFLEAVSRCLTYRVNQMSILERVAGQLMQRDLYEVPEMVPTGSYQDRESYQEGKFSSEIDLMDYKTILDEE